MARKKAGKPSGGAAIYARFSSHNQRDESIEIQLENCRAYCREVGLDVVGEYCDYAQTGRDTNRAEFQRMLRAAEAGAFSFVVIYKVTRIMRNRDEMAVLRIRLHKAGVEILYAGESIAEGSSGVLQLGMLEVLAEWESAILSERIRDGIRKNAERCMANGHQLYGWDIEGGRYVVNESEAESLREARSLVMAGASVAEAARVSMDGRVGKRGRPIGRSALMKLLRRPQNCGTYSYAGVTVEGGMPAIWSRAEQESLLATLDGRTVGRVGDSQEWFPLTGHLMHVHHDGTAHACRGTSGTSRNGTTHYYYQCRDCRQTLRKWEAEREVADAVRRALSDPAKVAFVADLVLSGEDDDEGPDEVSALEADLAEVDAAFGRIWDAIERGIDLPGLEGRVEALKARRARAEGLLAEARARRSVVLDRDSVEFWLSSVSGMPDDEVVAGFVSCVLWHGDGSIHVACAYDEPPAMGASGSNEVAMVEFRDANANAGIYAIRHGFVVIV